MLSTRIFRLPLSLAKRLKKKSCKAIVPASQLILSASQYVSKRRIAVVAVRSRCSSTCTSVSVMSTNITATASTAITGCIAAQEPEKDGARPIEGWLHSDFADSRKLLSISSRPMGRGMVHIPANLKRARQQQVPSMIKIIRSMNSIDIFSMERAKSRRELFRVVHLPLYPGATVVSLDHNFTARRWVSSSTSREKEKGEDEDQSTGDLSTRSISIPNKKKKAFARARAEGVLQRSKKGGDGLESRDTEDQDHNTGLHDPVKKASEDGRGDCDEKHEAAYQGAGQQRRQKKIKNSDKTKKIASYKRTPKEHPVLGRLIADLKYKRVYVTSIDAVSKATVWEKQQTLRPVHSIEIAEAKYFKNQVVDGIPGVITLYKRPLLPLTKTEQVYVHGIVDGQHRLGALLLLAEKGRWDRSEQNVIVEVFDTKDEKEVAQLFVEINRAEPATVMGIPEITPEEVDNCVGEVVGRMHKLYPKMLAERCNSPGLHAAIFADNLVKSGMVHRHRLFTPELLLDYLLRVNSILSKRESSKWAIMVGPKNGQYSTEKMMASALQRAKKHDFWLGLDSSWMIV